MSFKQGNKLYLLRKKDGRDREYKPEELYDKSNEYFQWAIDNPMEKELTFHAQGVITKTTEKVLRPFTIKGLCIYLGITHTTYLEYEKLNDYSKVTTHIRGIIENQQFEGATAGFFNPNIIARKLGLADKKELSGEVDVKQITGMEIK